MMLGGMRCRHEASRARESHDQDRRGHAGGQRGGEARGHPFPLGAVKQTSTSPRGFLVQIGVKKTASVPLAGDKSCPCARTSLSACRSTPPMLILLMGSCGSIFATCHAAPSQTPERSSGRCPVMRKVMFERRGPQTGGDNPARSSYRTKVLHVFPALALRLSRTATGIASRAWPGSFLLRPALTLTVRDERLPVTTASPNGGRTHNA